MNYRSRLWIFVGFVLLLLWGGAAAFYAQQLQDKRASAQISAANHALLLSEFVGRYLQSADATLSNIVRAVSSSYADPTGDFADRNNLLRSHDGFYQTLIDSKGFAVASTVPGMDLSKKPNYAFRGFFKHHAANPGTKALLGGPLVGKVTKIKFFGISRRISAPDGRFLGVVIGLVDAQYIADFFHANEIGGHGIAMLTHAVLKKNLTRVPRFDETFGQDISDSPLFQRNLDVEKVGNYDSTGQADDIKRAFSYRQVGDYPLVVNVGVAEIDLTQATLNSMKAVFLGLGVITILILLGAKYNLRFESELRKNEKRFREFANSASDWFWETDENLRFCFLSDRFEAVTGRSVKDILGKTRRDLLSNDQFGENEEKWMAHFDDLANHRPFRDFEYDILKDYGGKAVTISVSGVPVFDDEGVFKGYYGSGRDVTEQVLAQKELERAREVAEKASQAKTEFLSSMSHELRTPLNAINGFSQLLAADDLDDSQKESVDEILKAGEHLLGLINDVLDLARIESGNLSVSMEDVHPAVPLKQCLNMAKSMAKKHGVTVEGGPFPEDLPYIHADQTRFKQVLLNFLSNAIKYNKEGGRVDVTVETVADAMRFSISDTGFGIPADKQERLFVPFNRLGMEGSAVEGTGIGLVITKELVELMGGRVGFVSEENTGSTFWFELPLGTASDAGKVSTGAAVASATKTLEASMDPNNLKTILYIEDNPANLSLVEKIIARVPGLNLITAVTGEAGVELAKHAVPDVILMDINLPGMSGIEALGALRANEATRPIPVIALSAAAMDSDIRRGMDAGFVCYLTKPIKVNETLETIERVLSGTEEGSLHQD